MIEQMKKTFRQSTLQEALQATVCQSVHGERSFGLFSSDGSLTISETVTPEHRSSAAIDQGVVKESPPFELRLPLVGSFGSSVGALKPSLLESGCKKESHESSGRNQHGGRGLCGALFQCDENRVKLLFFPQDERDEMENNDPQDPSDKKAHKTGWRR